MILGHDTVGTNVTTGDARRRQVVAVVTAIYVLLIFEGVLRKWLLPGFSQALFFVRDPLVLVAYALAFAGSLWPPPRTLFVAGIALGIAALALAMVQFVVGPASIANPLLFEAYGWRNYFFYIPLAFLIGSVFYKEDVERIVRITLWLVLPIAVLVAFQFYASIDSVVNIGSADDPTQQFRGLGLTEDHVRPMGLFTSDAGQKEFTVSCVAMLLALWITPTSGRFIRLPLLVVASIAALTCLAFSGSRGALMQSGVVFVGAVVAALQMRARHGSRRGLLVLGGLGLAAAAIVVVAFGDAYMAFLTRWNSAFDFESQIFTGGIFGRALFGLVDFMRLMGDTPIIGYGLGLGGNASTLMGEHIGGVAPVSIAETDWARHVVDLGPVLGALFICFRIALVGWVGSVALRTARLSGEMMPLLLFAFLGLELLYGQITGQGTINGYGWLFTGFCLVSPRNLGAASDREGAVATVNAPRFPHLLR